MPAQFCFFIHASIKIFFYYNYEDVDLITNYKSSALKAFARGNVSKVDSRAVKKINLILNALDTATCIDDFDLPGCRLHRFSERDPVVWSLDVNANWRITFDFDGCNVNNVNLEDTH